MPLPAAPARREIHRRNIDMKVYARDDGLYDVESRLIDTKPFEFQRLSPGGPHPAGEPLHDLWVRFTIDEHYVVKAVDASSDATPFGLCKEAGSALSVLVGEKIARGWTALVKAKLRGAAGCTHQTDLLIMMATAAVQGVRGLWITRHPQEFRNNSGSRLDSCYAFGRHREVVKMLWPEHHRPDA